MVEAVGQIKRETGVYTPPVETLIVNIPTVIVDPHNEVFGYWFSQFFEKEPAVLVHVDSHADDIIDFAKDNKIGSCPHEYAKRELGCASFIAPAFFCGLVSDFYWVKMRTPQDKYNARVKVDIKKMYMPFVEKFKDEKLASKSGRPHILDIDLDAFSLYGEERSEEYGIEDDSPSRIGIRIYRAMNFLKTIPRPNLITIARSQTPKAYVKPKLVEGVQEELVRRLRECYQSIK